MALDRVGRSVMACCSVTYLTNSNRTPAKATEMATTTKGSAGSIANRVPAMTGPATADNCHVAEVVVMRRGRPSGVTTRGGIDRDAGFAKPRAVPNAPTNAKIGQTAVVSDRT